MPSDPAAIALPSTNGIADPQIRNFLDRLKTAWSAVTAGENRFIGAAEFSSLAQEAAAGMLSGGAGAAGATPSSTAPGSSVERLAQAIRANIVYQLLDERVSLDDIQQVRSLVSDAIDQARTGISSEQTVRSSQDTVLASAINRIWGYIGGSTAVIEDGALAAATPSAATATKWNSVISAVTDPNTGLIASAAILQETRTYANNVDATLNATYTVRAQVSSGGQTVVGGFGLAATSGAGSAAGATIDFGVLANKFFIAAPSSGYNPVTEYGTNLSNPFVVLTTSTTLNGVTYAPGVYMKKAVIGKAAIGSAEIGDASIGTAHIVDAAISYAKIGNAEIDELKLRGNSVTIPVATSTSTPLNIATPGAYTLITVPTFTSKGGTVTIMFGMIFAAFQPDAAMDGTVTYYRNGTPIRTFSPQFGFTMNFPPVTDVPGNGTVVTYSVGVVVNSSGPPPAVNAFIMHRGIVALEAIR